MKQHQIIFPYSNTFNTSLSNTDSLIPKPSNPTQLHVIIKKYVYNLLIILFPPILQQRTLLIWLSLEMRAIPQRIPSKKRLKFLPRTESGMLSHLNSIGNVITQDPLTLFCSQLDMKANRMSELLLKTTLSQNHIKHYEINLEKFD